MFILLISNHTVFLVQFGINLHLWVFQTAKLHSPEAARAISALWKTHSCKLIPNWTRNRMITYTNKPTANFEKRAEIPARNIKDTWLWSCAAVNQPINGRAVAWKTQASRQLFSPVKMKKDWVEQVGEKKMAAVFHFIELIELWSCSWSR